MNVIEVGTYDYRIAGGKYGGQTFKINGHTLIKGLQFFFKVKVKYLKRYHVQDLGVLSVKFNGKEVSYFDFETLFHLQDFTSLEKVMFSKKFGFFDFFNRELQVCIPYIFPSATDHEIKITITNDLAENLKNYSFMECKIYKVTL